MILRHRLISSVLYGQAEQFANAHRFHAGAHLFKSGFDVDVRVAAYDTGCTGYDILTDVEDRHHNVKVLVRGRSPQPP